MLDLGRELIRLEGVDLAPDHADPALFYVLPPPPRVVVGAEGPEVALLRLREGGAVREAHLRLGVELAHPEARLRAAVEALQARLALRDPPVLAPMIARRAEARLIFAGKEPEAPEDTAALVCRPLLAQIVSPSPPHRATLSAALSSEAAEIVAAALQGGGAPVGVAFQLEVETIWPAQRILVEVDWRRAYEHLSSHVRQGTLVLTRDVRELFEDLVEERLVRVTAIRGVDGSALAETAMDQALSWVEAAVVERFFDPVMPLDRAPAQTSLGTVGEIFGVGHGFAFKALRQEEIATGQVDLSRSAVLGRTLLVQAHLHDLMGGLDPASRIADVALGHPFFQRFSFTLSTARPLADTKVSEVVVRWRYGAAEESLRLDGAVAEATAETWADRSPDRRWSLTAEVRFADDAPLSAGEVVLIGPLEGAARRCVLDLEALLGWRALAVEAAPDAQVLQTRVTVSHQREGEELGSVELALTGDTRSGVLYFVGVRPGDRLVASTVHLLEDGRQARPEPADVLGTVLRVPPASPGEQLVTLYAEGDWEGLERLVVTLEKSPELPGGTFTFDRSGTSVTVALPLPDPANRSWRYRVLRTVDGVDEEEDWRVTDRPALSLGRYSQDVLAVTVEPLGPGFSSVGVHSVQVELRYFDPQNGIREETTLVLRSNVDRQTWKVALADPTSRLYQAQITTWYTNGQTRVIPWRDQTGPLLVVPIVASPG